MLADEHDLQERGGRGVRNWVSLMGGGGTNIWWYASNMIKSDHLISLNVSSLRKIIRTPLV